MVAEVPEETVPIMEEVLEVLFEVAVVMCWGWHTQGRVLVGRVPGTILISESDANTF